MTRAATTAVLLAALLAACAPQPGSQPGPQSGQISSDGSRKERSADGRIEGDVVGTARPGSRFALLRIGMSQQEAEDLVGRPTDTDSHITGKSFIPFYFGGDQYRVVDFYRGQGQLEFGPRNFGGSANALMRIVNNPAESGYSH